MPVGSGQHVDVQARMIMAAVTWPLSIAWTKRQEDLAVGNRHDLGSYRFTRSTRRRPLVEFVAL
jgi:hypothetical protein